jgi:hypothetical protein
MALAYSAEHTAATTVRGVAREFQICPRTVRRARALIGEVYLKRQCSFVKAVVDNAASLNFVVWTLGWDSTGKLMTLPAHRALKPSQQRGVWHCLVSLCDMVCAWKSDARDSGTVGPLCLQAISLVRPPIPMMSTSADCLNDALFECKTIAEDTKHAESLFAAALHMRT